MPPSGAEKGVALHWALEGDTARRHLGGEVRFRQVLVNLIGNAVKFTDRGRIDLRLRGRHRPNGDIELIVEVEDTGCGIAPDRQAQIFEKFVQADASTTRKFGGTGLGLAISYELVQRMGGQLSVRSALGRGSVFTFCLDVEAVQLPIKSQPEKERTGDVSDVDVLVVEDNSVNVMVIQRMLTRLGVSVRVCQDGRAAVDACIEQPPDLIFMDCQMPVMDGYEATRQIRTQLDGGPPIIALTANALSGDREKCLAAGMNDFLTKPVRSNELRDRLLQFLPRAQKTAVRQEAAPVT